MRDAYLGVDPGAKGYVCVYWADKNQYTHCPIADTDALKDLLLRCSECHCIAAVESVHSMPRQGLSTTFAFGRNVGLVYGMLLAYGIPYVEASPQKWQKEMWSAGDKVLRDGKTDNKGTSYNAARSLIGRVERDTLLEELVRSYIETH